MPRGKHAANLCMDCQNACGGCEWTEADPKTGKIRFAPVPGWTVDVIAHILSHIPGITAQPVEVLSMYDGMSCGHIALDKLGANVARYYATEIDKYAIQTTQANYPDTVQLEDAFQVRDDGWAV